MMYKNAISCFCYSNDINQLTFNYINPKINIDNILKIEKWNINNKPNTEILS